MNYVMTDLQDPEIFTPVKEGRFSLGSGDDDVIYLADSYGAVPEHVKLVFLGGVLTILEVNAPIWVDGDKVSVFPYDVTPNQVISVSEDCHFSFTQEGSDLPPIPLIERAVDETLFANVDKKTVQRAIVLFSLAAVGIVIALLSTVFFSSKPAKHEMPTPPAVQMIGQEQVEQYLQETFGSRLLRVSFDEAQCVIWLNGDKAVPDVSEQVDSILAKMDKPRKALIMSVDLATLTKNVQDEFGKKGFKVEVIDNQITVSGTVPPKLVEATIAQINQAQEPFAGFMTVTAQISPDDRYNVKLVSVSLGAKGASATLRYKETWTIVEEGGKVFGIGILKQVRAQSIVVATSHGEMIIGL